MGLRGTYQSLGIPQACDLAIVDRDETILEGVEDVPDPSAPRVQVADPLPVAERETRS